MGNKVKMTVGGMLGYKIQGRQYESIDASTVITIESEEEFSVDKINEMSDKVDALLEERAVQRMKVAYKTYKDKIVKIASLID